MAPLTNEDKILITCMHMYQSSLTLYQKTGPKQPGSQSGQVLCVDVLCGSPEVCADRLLGSDEPGHDQQSN